MLLINERMMADEVRKLMQDGGHAFVLSFLRHLDERYEEMIANSTQRRLWSTGR